MKNLYLRASLTLTALVLSFVSFGQSLSCVNPNGNYTRPDSIEHCKGSSGGSFNQHWLDRIAAQGGIDSAGIKSSNHNRSVFVNESINRRGGFAVIQDLGTKVKPNADAVGSTFAIDTDGDCIYEREDSLLNKLQFNLVDEIILYNVSRILEDGDKTVVGGPGIPDGIFDNNLQVNQSAEWHLARFIDKAKNVGFNVVAVLPEGNINPTDSAFYKFHTSFAENTSQFSSYLEGINDAFLQKYMDLWLYAPQEVTY